jgi:hypothetical protein
MEFYFFPFLFSVGITYASDCEHVWLTGIRVFCAEGAKQVSSQGTSLFYPKSRHLRPQLLTIQSFVCTPICCGTAEVDSDIR